MRVVRETRSTRVRRKNDFSFSPNTARRIRLSTPTKFNVTRSRKTRQTPTCTVLSRDDTDVLVPFRAVFLRAQSAVRAHVETTFCTYFSESPCNWFPGGTYRRSLTVIVRSSAAESRRHNVNKCPPNNEKKKTRVPFLVIFFCIDVRFSRGGGRPKVSCRVSVAAGKWSYEKRANEGGLHVICRPRNKNERPRRALPGDPRV